MYGPLQDLGIRSPNMMSRLFHGRWRILGIFFRSEVSTLFSTDSAEAASGPDFVVPRLLVRLLAYHPYSNPVSRVVKESVRTRFVVGAIIVS